MGSRKRGKQATPPPDLEVTVLESLRTAPGVTVTALKKHVPVSHKKFVTNALIKSLADRGDLFLVKKRIFSTDPAGEVDALVLESVRVAPGVTLPGLKARVPISHRDLVTAALLKSLAERGDVFVAGKGKSKSVFPTDPFAEIDSKLPGYAAQEPVEKSMLKELVGEVAPGYEAVFDDWVKRALAERRLFEHAATKPKGKKRLGRVPDITSSLKSVLKALKTALPKLDAQGVPRERVAAVLLEELGLQGEARFVGTNGAAKASVSSQQLSAEVRTRFMAALERLANDNPRDALHSVRALRSRAGLGKQEFDTVALELAREGRVSLHHHDHATGLPEAERLQLIQDDRGTYFNGIAPRRGHD